MAVLAAFRIGIAAVFPFAVGHLFRKFALRRRAQQIAVLIDKAGCCRIGFFYNDKRCYW